MLQCMTVWHIPKNILEAGLDFETPCPSGPDISHVHCMLPFLSNCSFQEYLHPVIFHKVPRTLLVDMFGSTLLLKDAQMELKFRLTK